MPHTAFSRYGDSIGVLGSVWLGQQDPTNVGRARDREYQPTKLHTQLTVFARKLTLLNTLIGDAFIVGSLKLILQTVRSWRLLVCPDGVVQYSEWTRKKEFLHQGGVYLTRPVSG